MARFERKNRTDIVYKGCGGITDAFDDMYKQLWRINDDEYDYLCETLTDEELSDITPEFKSISQIKKAISIVNNALLKMSYNVHYCTCSVQVIKTSRFKTNLAEFTNN